MSATNMFQQTSPELELQHPPPASHAAHSARGGLRAPTSPLRQFTAPSPNEELHTFDTIELPAIIQPPPSVLTSNVTAYDPHRDSPSPLEDYPRAGRSSHQRTLTGTFLNNSQSFLNRATSTLQQHTSAASIRSHSPTKSLASFLPSRSAIDSTKNWFNGSSAPVKLGVQQQDEDTVSESGSEVGSEFYSSDSESEGEEDEEAHNTMNIFNRRPTHTSAGPESPSRPEQTATPTKPQYQSPASSRFAWLLSTQKNAATPSPGPAPTYHNASDDLLNLNISQALFPHGPVDPLAPSSFNDLLVNAEALLSRYQKSYRQLSTALVDAQSEQSAQDDELDEAETRARHLKMQLETMAARATEQDEQMRILMEELAFERHARQEEEAARKRSLALIRGGQSQCSCQDTPRRRNRVSNSELSVDSGFESDAETDAASLFSRSCLSPTGTDRSSILETEPDVTPKNRKVQSLQRGSTYDKPRGGLVSVQSWGCANCEGGSQASVWGRLSKEREENRVLRQRVEALEEAVEGALDVVGGQWGTL